MLRPEVLLVTELDFKALAELTISKLAVNRQYHSRIMKTMFEVKLEKARIFVVLLAFGWGFNWIAGRMILGWLEPWTMRAIGVGLGAATLLFSVTIFRNRLTLSKRQFLHIAIASSLNVIVFNICSAYAQVFGTTGRAVVIAYSMPIWAAILARLVLREKLDYLQLVAIALCLGGLATVIAPQAVHGMPLGALFALGCAWGWAGGTVYLKWARVEADAVVVTAWQLLIGFIVLATGMCLVEGLPDMSELPPSAYGWIAYNGLIGLGVSYLLWFLAVERLPAVTASLGVLLVPVVGIVSATLFVEETMTFSDVLGFGLIFVAAVCALVRKRSPATQLPE